MKDEQIDKIAQAIAAKLAEPGGKKLLGCGDASSSQYYQCSATYSCSSYYECGGAAGFNCTDFDCNDDFYCANNRYVCTGNFRCYGSYTED